MKLKIEKVVDNAIIPGYATPDSAGFDLHSVIDIDIPNGKSALIPTGLIFEIPEGYEMQIRPRSGLALKYSITVLNSPGTIDPGYRGQLSIILINHGTTYFHISAGDRVAQAVISKYEKVDIVEDTVNKNTERGIGGFGSTGL